MQTLVIDTSYGSTVGMVGHDPIVETDSRTHVEKLQVNIATTVEQAGLKPENIDRIIVGIGPAPSPDYAQESLQPKRSPSPPVHSLSGRMCFPRRCLCATRSMTAAII